MQDSCAKHGPLYCFELEGISKNKKKTIGVCVHCAKEKVQALSDETVAAYMALLERDFPDYLIKVDEEGQNLYFGEGLTRQQIVMCTFQVSAMLCGNTLDQLIVGTCAETRNSRAAFRQ